MKKILRQIITGKTIFLIPLLLLSLTLLFCLTTVSAAPGDAIYVNGSSGNDSWDGLSATWTSGTSGPKLSIKNATGTVNTNGTIHIANGQYKDENNTNITIDKNMNIIGESQTGTIINGTGTNWIFQINLDVNVTLTNLTLTNATAGNGGAIYNNGNLTVTNCTFTSNKATSSVNIDGGGAILNIGTITSLNDCIFTDNTATTGSGAILNGEIIINDGTILKGTITSLNSCTFTNNTATGTLSSGAIFNIGTITSLNDCNFTNNTATAGGAIFNIGTITSLRDCNFTNNTASGGGALCNYGNITSLNDCNFTNNTATAGGAIYNYGTITNLSNCNFTNNTATGTLGSGAILNGGTITNLSNCNFTNNTASGGGAIFNINTITNLSSCNFTNNTATGTFGGGAILSGGNIASLSSCNFTDNIATNGGGAICNLHTIDNLNSCNFTKNKAAAGGAIFSGGIILNGEVIIAESTIISLSGCTFTNNTATDNNGGAIYNIGNLTATNSLFMHNNAAQGGAIYNNGTSTINGCIFNNNSIYSISDAIGGAICNICTLTVVNCTFNNNSASGGSNVMGGAIGNLCRVSNSGSSSVNCTVTNCKFTGNSAQSGGAILNLCQVSNSGSGSVNCTVTNCKFTGNTATDWDGGAISNRYFVRGGSGFTNCTVTGCIFTNNIAVVGGALSNGGSTLNANFNRFYNNTATTNGTALYCNGGSVDANYNWWSSNKSPKTIQNLIYDPDNLVDANTWVILTVKANPTTINNTQKSTITADLNHINGGGELIGGHIPDGPVTLDIPWGSFTKSGITHSITMNTVAGVMTALFYANEGAVPHVNPVKATATADGYTTNDTESAYITINKTSDLYIKTTSNNNNPKLGEKFLLTYKLGNKGPDAADNVTITFQLPKGLEFVNIKVDTGKYTYDPITRTITWTLNSVPVGDPYLYLTVKAADDGNYKITPNITSDTYNLNSGDDGIITFNVQPNSNENTVNAASKTTIGLQKTGLPLNYLLLAVLMVLSGLIPKRK